MKALAPLLFVGLLSAGNPHPLFSFHSGFWINLHHFLYEQAFLQKPGRRPRGIPERDSALLAGLSGKDKDDWTAAVAYYAQHFSGKDLLFDTGMVRIKNILEDQDSTAQLHDLFLPAGMASVVNAVAQSYRERFWPAEDAANHRWIDRTSHLVATDGERVAGDLAQLYKTPWPGEPIRVDVTNYASWSGAYTTIDPTRITVSSTDTANQQLAGLEVVFHEASHALIDSIAAAIDEACHRQQKTLPNPSLWHAVLFFTTGEVIRRYHPGYVPYAYKNGLWKRAWPMYVGPLEREWLPYINGETSLDTAVARLVRAV
ncbi:hypothetical protein [Dinghuibacter silviterrae]|uniref:DUF4932 domain-containing protein n=1 Tax=Dinghuibacter silviterrae TaxID=1539049 RepID=A0A4R8DQE4_9BACT|nr:hypothetical protein [Dinghuibacter silviterrae]TDX00362.1 hypothetical protein EDB95_1384 [Dinghuibacter silviterrae]